MKWDTPHVFNMVYTWDLPFGKGANRWNRMLAGGWTFAGLHQYRSGTLLQPTFPNTLAAYLFNPALRVNLTGTSIQTNVDRTTLDPDNPAVRWFNRTAFSLPDTLQFGTAPAYLTELRTPPILSENMSLIKRFNVIAGDQPLNFELGAEASNVFNRTLFGGINVNLTDPNFGRPTGVQIGPRFIQMRLKINF